MSVVEDPPDLRSAVRNLARVGIQEIRAAMEAGQLPSTTEVRLETKVLSVNHNQGNLGWSAQHIFRAVPSLDMSRQFEFVNQKIKPTSAYAECKKTLSAHSSDSNPEQLEFFLHQFSIRLVQNIVQDPSGDSADRLCEIFVADIDHVPIWFSVACGLSGIWIEGDDFRFSRYGLRKTSMEDISAMLESPIPGGPRLTMLAPPATILEFNIKAPEAYVAQKESGFVTSVLLLSGHGSVRTVFTAMKAETLLRPVGRLGGPSWDGSSRYKYAISERNGAALEGLVNILRPSLESDKPSESLRAILRALQRYQTSVTAPNDLPSTIALSISTLEALFLRGQERSELGNRLSNRVAIFLRECGENPLKLRKLIVRAYDIRSTFIHGDEMESETPLEMERICVEISNVARQAVLLMLQIHEEISKEDLISRLDNSLLEHKSADKLRELLDGKIKGIG